MNHKRHSPTNKADSDIMGSWSGGTLPAKKRISPVPDEVKPVPSKKPKDYCIKLKGPHCYAVGMLKYLLWDGSGWVVRRCSGCGKKNYWLI